MGEKLSQRSDPSCQRQWSLSQNAEAVLTNVTFMLSPARSGLVHILLRKLKPNKATGLDNIPTRLLKDGDPVILACLTHIINLSFASGVMPNDWKIARVVPLFKSGNRQEMNNYRPISILPVILKIAEKVVYHQPVQLFGRQQSLVALSNWFPEEFLH